MLCADPPSEIELSSLMNLSGVNDSGWGNAVYKTGRRLVWELMCRRCGCGYERGLNGRDYYWWAHVKDIKATLLHSETVARYAPPG